MVVEYIAVGGVVISLIAYLLVRKKGLTSSLKSQGRWAKKEERLEKGITKSLAQEKGRIQKEIGQKIARQQEEAQTAQKERQIAVESTREPKKMALASEKKIEHEQKHELKEAKVELKESLQNARDVKKQIKNARKVVKDIDKEIKAAEAVGEIREVQKLKQDVQFETAVVNWFERENQLLQQEVKEEKIETKEEIKELKTTKKIEAETKKEDYSSAVEEMRQEFMEGLHGVQKEQIELKKEVIELQQAQVVAARVAPAIQTETVKTVQEEEKLLTLEKEAEVIDRFNKQLTTLITEAHKLVEKIEHGELKDNFLDHVEVISMLLNNYKSPGIPNINHRIIKIRKTAQYAGIAIIDLRREHSSLPDVEKLLQIFERMENMCNAEIINLQKLLQNG